MEIIGYCILICAFISWIFWLISICLDIETNPTKQKYIKVGILGFLIVFTIIALLINWS